MLCYTVENNASRSYYVDTVNVSRLTLLLLRKAQPRTCAYCVFFSENVC